MVTVSPQDSGSNPRMIAVSKFSKQVQHLLDANPMRPTPVEIPATTPKPPTYYLDSTHMKAHLSTDPYVAEEEENPLAHQGENTIKEWQSRRKIHRMHEDAGMGQF